MQRFPQELINVRVLSKEGLSTSTKITHEVAKKQEELGSAGRILVRASGTENLVRVMVEAQGADQARQIAEELASLVRSELS